MRYQMSAANQFQSIANAAGVTAPSISDHPFFGGQIDRIYHAYPRFLLLRLEEEIRQKLYFPWEKVGSRQPLYVHISTTHHWGLEQVRQLDDDDLLEILRPEIQKLRIAAPDVEEILGTLGELMPSEIAADLRARIGSD